MKKKPLLSCPIDATAVHGQLPRGFASDARAFRQWWRMLAQANALELTANIDKKHVTKSLQNILT
ncbi:MAG: hypothetical protein ACRDAM_22555 [Casimicrobium sp.]